MRTMCNHGVPLGARDHRTVAKGCDGVSGDGTWVSHCFLLEQDAAAELSSAFPFRRPDIYDGLVVFARIRWLHEVRHAFVLQRHSTARHCTSAAQC